MKKRKHRFYIDVTYSSPIAMRDAAKGLDLVLRERLDLQRAPVWAYDHSPYIDKLTVTEMRHPVTR